MFLQKCLPLPTHVCFFLLVLVVQQCISTVIHGGRRGKKRMAAKQQQAAEGLALGYARMRFSECIIWRSRIENEAACCAQRTKSSSRRVIMSGSGFNVTSTCSLLSLSMSILWICYPIIDWLHSICWRDEHSVTLLRFSLTFARLMSERMWITEKWTKKEWQSRMIHTMDWRKIDSDEKIVSHSRDWKLARARNRPTRLQGKWHSKYLVRSPSENKLLRKIIQDKRTFARLQVVVSVSRCISSFRYPLQPFTARRSA